MSRELPIVLRIPGSLLEGRSAWASLLATEMACAPQAASGLASRFEFRNDERAFAARLFACKRNLRVYRCNQQRFCGDFVVVDMSSPDPAKRPVLVMDLKFGAPLRRGGGGAGVQFRNAADAVAAIERRGDVLAGASRFELLSGDRREVLRFFGADEV